MGGKDLVLHKPIDFIETVAALDGDIGALNQILATNAGSAYLTGPKIAFIDLLVFSDTYAMLAILPKDTISLGIYEKFNAWY